MLKLPFLRLAALTITALSFPAQADETKLDLSFYVYSGGYRALTLEADLDLTPQRYRLITNSKTSGLADTLFKYRQRAEANGNRTPVGLSPIQFLTESDSRFSYRSAEIQYTEEWPIIEKMEPKLTEDQREEVPEGMRRATLDPLSGSLLAVTRDLEFPCTGTVPVFDGRRRYDLKFNAIGEETLEKAEGGGYIGTALRCQVEFEPIAGFVKRDTDTPTEKRLPTELWLARLAPGTPYLPVRLTSDSVFGKFTGYLIRAKIDGQPVFRGTEDNN